MKRSKRQQPDDEDDGGANGDNGAIGEYSFADNFPKQSFLQTLSFVETLKNWNVEFRRNEHLPNRIETCMIEDSDLSQNGTKPNQQQTSTTATTGVKRPNTATTVSRPSTASTVTFQEPNEELTKMEKAVNLEKKIAQKQKIKCITYTIPYCLNVYTVANITVPISMFKPYQSPRVDYRLHFTFYHTITKQFIGTTFKSPPSSSIQTQERSTVLKQTAKFNLPIFFHSSIVDEHVILVAEVIMIIKENSFVVQNVGIGWSPVRIFKDLNYGKSLTSLQPLESFWKNPQSEYGKGGVSSGTPLITEIPFYKGTPRILQQLNEPNMEKSLTKQAGLKLLYSLFRNKGMTKTSFLIPENHLVCDSSAIPGLYNPKKVSDNTLFLKPKIFAPKPIHVMDFEITIPSQLETKLIEFLREQRIQEHLDLKNSTADIEIFERKLTIGVHNTYTFLQQPYNADLIVTNKTDTGHVTTLSASAAYKLNSYFKHDLCAIIFELYYIVNFPLPMNLIQKGGILERITQGKSKLQKKEKPQIEYQAKKIYLGIAAFTPVCYNFENGETVKVKMTTGPLRSYSGFPVHALQSKNVEKKNSIEMSFKISGMLDKRSVPLEKTTQVFRSSKTEKVRNSKSSTLKDKSPRIPKQAPIEPPLPENKLPSELKIPTIVLPPPISSEEPAIPILKKENEQVIPEDIHQRLTKLDESEQFDTKKSEPFTNRSRVKVPIGRSQEVSKEMLEKINSRFKPTLDSSGRPVIEENISIENKSIEILLENEMLINFLTYIPPEDDKGLLIPKSFYFRFHFYTFEEASTVSTPVYLLEDDGKLKGTKYLSVSEKGSKDTSSGFQLRFNVNCARMIDEERKQFKEYLTTRCTFVDIFDAETSFKFGTVKIPLIFWMRDDWEKSTQRTREYTISEPFEEVLSFDRNTVVGAENEIGLSVDKGKLVIRTTNVGHKARSESDLEESRRLNSAKFNFELPYESSKNVVARQLPEAKQILSKYNNANLTKSAMIYAIQEAKQFREKQRKLKISEELEKLNTAKRLIFVSLGTAHYFYLEFENWYEEESSFSIMVYEKKLNSTTEQSLQLVQTDKEVMNSSLKDDELCRQWTKYYAPSKAQMESVMKLPGLTKVHIPFKYQSFKNKTDVDNIISDAQVFNVFVHKKTAETSSSLLMKKFVVKFEMRNTTFVTRSFQFSYPLDPMVNCFQKYIRYQSELYGNQTKKDSKVLVQGLKSDDNTLKCSVSNLHKNYTLLEISKIAPKNAQQGDEERFLVFLYADKYCSKLIEVWKVSVVYYGFWKMEKAYVGQTNRKELMFNEGNDFALIQQLTKNRRSIACHVSRRKYSAELIGNEVLVKGIELRGRPSQEEVFDALVHLVITPKREVIGRFAVRVHCLKPIISKSFKPQVIRLGVSQNMRLAFKNTNTTEWTYNISTNHPEYLEFDEPQISLQPEETHKMRMKFLPSDTVQTVDFLIFVNDSVTDVTEDCYSITVNYVSP